MSDIEFEAMLSYWISSYVLPSGPKNDFNSYVFPLPIRLARGDWVALAPIILVRFFIVLTSMFTT